MTLLRFRTYWNSRVIEREAETRVISRIVEAKEVMRNGTKWNTYKKGKTKGLKLEGDRILFALNFDAIGQ